jgi:hypothetical protein
MQAAIIPARMVQSLMVTAPPVTLVGVNVKSLNGAGDNDIVILP